MTKETNSLIERLRLIASGIAGFQFSDFIEAADRIEALSAECEALREHVREQITFALSRIQDGRDMGAAIWRIALEDIVRENRTALQQTNRESGNVG